MRSHTRGTFLQRDDGARAPGPALAHVLLIPYVSSYEFLIPHRVSHITIPGNCCVVSYNAGSRNLSFDFFDISVLDNISHRFPVRVEGLQRLDIRFEKKN